MFEYLKFNITPAVSVQLHQQQKSNPVCVHPHQVRHRQDVEF
jgi:hypothetical protein